MEDNYLDDQIHIDYKRGKIILMLPAIFLWGTLFGITNLLLGLVIQRLLMLLPWNPAMNQQHITLLLGVFSLSLLVSLAPPFFAGYCATVGISDPRRGTLTGIWSMLIATLLGISINMHQQTSWLHTIGLLLAQIVIGCTLGILGSKYNLWQRHWADEPEQTYGTLKSSEPAERTAQWSTLQMPAMITHRLQQLKNWCARPDVRTALTLTLALRVFCTIVALLATSLIPGPYLLVGELPLRYVSTLLHSPPPLTMAGWITYLSQPWDKWDTGWYAGIAIGGYGTFGTTAFLPLYPLSIRVVGMLPGGNVIAASLLVSTICCFGTLLNLHRIAERLSTVAGVARWTIIIGSLLPVSFFLVAGYTEAMFLWATFGAILAMFSRQWRPMVIWAIVASLTRHQGPLLSLLVLPTILATLRRWAREHWVMTSWKRVLRELRGPLLAALAGPAVYLGWACIVGMVLHQPLPWEPLTAARGWNLHLAPPTTGIFSDLWSLAHPGIPSAMGLLADAIDAGGALLVAAIIIIFARRLPLAITIFAIGCWCLALIKVEPDGETMSTARYLLPLLPLVVLVSEKLVHSRPLVQLIWISMGSLSVFFFTWYFVLGAWVN